MGEIYLQALCHIFSQIPIKSIHNTWMTSPVAIIYCNLCFPQSKCLNSNLPLMAKCTSGKGKQNSKGLDLQARSTQQSKPERRKVTLSVLSAPWSWTGCLRLAPVEMRRPCSLLILPIVCFNLSLFLCNKEPIFGHWGEEHSPRNGSSTVICAMQQFATPHLWCRITVMIKASLISSEVCLSVCSPCCLPATGQDVSFTLDSNDAGKTNHSSVASFPQACFHPHPSMRGQMEIRITSGRRFQVYPLRGGLLREGHLFYLFPAPWSPWNELRRFSETFGSVCLWTEAWPSSITQGCCFGCQPQAQSTADFGDMMEILWHTNIFLWASPMAPLLFMLVRQCRDPWGESKYTVLLNLTNSPFSLLKLLDFKAKSRWMFLRRKADPFSVWTIKLYLKEWGKGLKSLV